MEYIVLLVVVAGCLALIWHFSRRAGSRERVVDLDALRKAAEHGDVFAQHTLAYAYQIGQGVPRDLGAAIQWYRRAAEQGHVEAQYTLAGLLDNGEGESRDADEAHAWYTKAALHGHVAAQNVLASVKWKEEAQPSVAPQSHAASPPAADLSSEELDKLFEKAENGDVDAQYNLGIMYYNGEGTPRDYQQAMTWFLLAAQQGDVDAQFNMGIMIGRGEGIKKDPKVALQWFQKAAEQGHSEAQEIIAKRGKS